jgi:hypothetical protein
VFFFSAGSVVSHDELLCYASAAASMLHRLAESFPWLRSGVELVRLCCFLLFAALGFRIIWLERRERETARAIFHFVLYSLTVTCLAGFTQIEAWPFTTWALVHNISPKTMIDWKIEGVTASGKTYPIDPRFIEPLPYEDFDTWLKTRFLPLGLTEEEARVCYLKPHPVTPEQAQIARFLVWRAEQARLRFLRGESAGTNGWLLHGLSAPFHFDRPRLWRSEADVPETPFVGLRIWQLDWNVEERYRDESRVRRRLLFDYTS